MLVKFLNSSYDFLNFTSFHCDRDCKSLFKTNLYFAFYTASKQKSLPSFSSKLEHTTRQILIHFCFYWLQRLQKRKQKKQVELDKCAFDPEHMAEESHNGGSFPMVNCQALCPPIDTTEKALLKKMDCRTLLLESCVKSSYFETTISDCSVASILYSLWPGPSIKWPTQN